MQLDLLNKTHTIPFLTNETFILDGSGTTITVYSDVVDVSDYGFYQTPYIVTGKTGTITLTITRLTEDAYGNWVSTSLGSITSIGTSFQAATPLIQKRFKLRFDITGTAGSSMSGVTYTHLYKT